MRFGMRLASVMLAAALPMALRSAPAQGDTPRAASPPPPAAAAPAPAAPASAASGSAASGAAAGARTDEQEEAARARFRRGVQLYDEGDFKLALIEFNRAYEIAPNYRVLYNIGEVQVQLGHYVSAMRMLREFLKQGGDAIPPDRRADVERDIASLRPRTATLAVRVSVAGAKIEVDQELLGVSPTTPQLVDGGEHRVRVTKPGYQPNEQKVVLAAGDVSDVYVTIVPLPPPAERSSERPSHPEVWGSWAGTAALAVAAGVCGGLALKENSDLKTLRDTAGSSETDRENAANQARTFAVTTDVLGAAAIVGAAVSVYFTVRKPAPSTVRMGIGPGSVLVSGRF